MPRMKQKPEDIADREFLSALGGWMTANRLTVAETADALNISESTLRRRMKNPEDITLGELRQMAKKCRWDREALGRMVR